jgi:hypothetical protein
MNELSWLARNIIASDLLGSQCRPSGIIRSEISADAAAAAAVAAISTPCWKFATTMSSRPNRAIAAQWR